MKILVPEYFEELDTLSEDDSSNKLSSVGVGFLLGRGGGWLFWNWETFGRLIRFLYHAMRGCKKRKGQIINYKALATTNYRKGKRGFFFTKLHCKRMSSIG